jgi:hypothetical protein
MLVAGRCRVCPMARDLPCLRNERYDAQRIPAGSKCGDPPGHSATIAQLHFRLRCDFSKLLGIKLSSIIRPKIVSEKLMLPKRRFGKAEPTVLPSAFSTQFSTIRSPNRVLTPLKSMPSRVQRACMPSCFNIDVHVKLNFRVTR